MQYITMVTHQHIMPLLYLVTNIIYKGLGYTVDLYIIEYIIICIDMATLIQKTNILTNII